MRTIYTLGHSNLAFAAFADLLSAQSVEILVDVRAAPWSRRYPHFGRTALEQALATRNIRYRWLGAALGGLRVSGGATAHPALQPAAFQAYAEHMRGELFNETLNRVCRGAARYTLALMCAEANHTQCHRQFIADALLVRGATVQHLHPLGHVAAHVLHPSLRLVGTTLLYDRQAQSGLFNEDTDRCT